MFLIASFPDHYLRVPLNKAVAYKVLYKFPLKSRTERREKSTGNDQEMAQSEKKSTNRWAGKAKMTLRNLYQENIS